jgi:hypothetical protein
MAQQNGAGFWFRPFQTGDYGIHVNAKRGQEIFCWSRPALTGLPSSLAAKPFRSAAARRRFSSCPLLPDSPVPDSSSPVAGVAPHMHDSDDLYHLIFNSVDYAIRETMDKVTPNTSTLITIRPDSEHGHSGRAGL